MKPQIKAQWLAEMHSYISQEKKRAEAFQEQDKFCPMGLLARLNGFKLEPYKPAVVLGKAMLQEYANKVTCGYSWPKTAENWPTPAVAMRIVDMNSEKHQKKYVHSWSEIAKFIEDCA